MNDDLIYTSPTWNEVLTEQAERNTVCSENSRKEEILRDSIIKKYPQYKEYVKFMNIERLYMYEYKLENITKQINQFERKLKYGYPKKCPAMQHLTNLIIF